MGKGDLGKSAQFYLKLMQGKYLFHRIFNLSNFLAERPLLVIDAAFVYSKVHAETI